MWFTVYWFTMVLALMQIVQATFSDILRRRSANGGMIRNGVSSDLMRETQRYLPSHPNSEWMILENLFNDSPKTRPILRDIRKTIGNPPLGSPKEVETIQLSGVEVRVDEHGNIVFLDLMNRLNGILMIFTLFLGKHL